MQQGEVHNRICKINPWAGGLKWHADVFFFSLHKHLLKILLLMRSCHLCWLWHITKSNFFFFFFFLLIYEENNVSVANLKTSHFDFVPGFRAPSHHSPWPFHRQRIGHMPGEADIIEKKKKFIQNFNKGDTNLFWAGGKWQEFMKTLLTKRILMNNPNPEIELWPKSTIMRMLYFRSLLRVHNTRLDTVSLRRGTCKLGPPPQSLDSRNTLKISLGWLSYSDFKVDSLKTIITWHLNLLFNTMNRFIQIERFLYAFF